MAWTDPSGHVYATGEVVTASTMNTYIKDNLIDLDRRTTTTAAVVATSQTTTSTTYADLTTTGPAVTVTIGSTGLALVSIYASLKTNTNGAFTVMGFAISGATTVAATDTKSLAQSVAGAQFESRLSTTHLISGLTAGSNTFTAKYRVSAGTGTYVDRQIMVTPLGS